MYFTNINVNVCDLWPVLCPNCNIVLSVGDGKVIVNSEHGKVFKCKLVEPNKLCNPEFFSTCEKQVLELDTTSLACSILYCKIHVN